jgi:hypothetical protein
MILTVKRPSIKGLPFQLPLSEKWKSVQQKSVSLSTDESEWYAASETGKKLLYLRIIMREFGFPQLGPMYLYEDSRAVIAMAENPSNRKGA